MTTAHDVASPRDARPPAWADALLRRLLEPADRESLSGDLLEEYREAIVPARGRKADRWYVWQVAGFLWRASWMWGVIVGATVVIRYLSDTLAPVTYTPGVIHVRSQLMSNALMAIFALAALHAVWRTRHVRAGLLVAVASSVIGGVISIAGTGLMLAVWHDPATLRAWQTSGGLGEALYGVPLLLLPIGAITGTAGAIVGKGLAWSRRRTV